jgi:hypothetical protein
VTRAGERALLQIFSTAARSRACANKGIREVSNKLARPGLRYLHVLLLACVVVASLVLRVHVSKQCSLWLDEVWTLRDASVAWPNLLRGPSREHPPLMYVLVRLTVDVFGTSALAVRGVSLFFGCALLVAVYRLALELELTRIEALLTVVSVALAPFFMRHATEARQYAMVSTFTTLELACVLRLLREPRDFAALVGVALTAAAAAATHYFGLVYGCALLGALAVGTFSSWRNAVAARRVSPRVAVVLGSLGLVLALVALRAAWLFIFYRTHTIGPRPRDLEGDILTEFAFLPTRTRPGVQVLLASLGLILLGARQRGIARVLPFAMGLPPLGLALLLSSGHAVAPRYLAPSWVLYQVGSAAAFVAVARALRASTRRWLRAAGTLLAAPLVLLPLVLRIEEYPEGYGTGALYYAGLQAFFHDSRGRTALVVYPDFPGGFIMRWAYPVDAPLVALDHFEPVPGVRRYVVAEFERASRIPELEALVEKEFHVSPREWRRTPLVHLPHTAFQRPVRARMLYLQR